MVDAQLSTEIRDTLQRASQKMRNKILARNYDKAPIIKAMSVLGKAGTGGYESDRGMKSEFRSRFEAINYINRDDSPGWNTIEVILRSPPEMARVRDDIRLNN
jgi:hypothetical protein